MKNKVLYLSYTGMMEALGASQVLNYLYGLADDFKFYLISLEKEIDFYDIEKKQKLKELLTQNGIQWYPILYRNGAKGYPINFYNVHHLAKILIKREKIKLLHCRSYMPAIIAYLLQKRNKKIRYIFDTRGFWFDEKADVGDWSRNRFAYRFAKRIEKKLYLSASHIVMLSHYGKETIQMNELFKGGNQLNNITVIATCVDLNKFHINNNWVEKPKLTIGYVGTAIGWYDFESTAKVLATIKKQFDFNLLIFNNGQHDYIRQELAKYKITDYQLEKIQFENMAERMREIDISLFFIHPVFSKRASAATKLGELLATGIPVITNAGVGDHEYYIEKHSIGEIIDSNEINNYDFAEIISKLNNVDCKKRCREVAEKYFSLDKGIESYKTIYQQLLKE